jgi:hypothetical protein
VGTDTNVSDLLQIHNTSPKLDQCGGSNLARRQL